MEQINFRDISYLAKGSPDQRKVYQVLQQTNIMGILAKFDPVLIGTFPLNIAIQSSDVDIGCCCGDLHEFEKVVWENFKAYPNFTLQYKDIDHIDTCVVNFNVGALPIELFAQNRAVEVQYGYRHMLVEHAILQQKGEVFRRQVVALKQQGLKTEPAFARLLSLVGDPYLSLLEYKVSK